ncbi:peptidoglycan-binding protein LysM [Methylocaldum szegediense]|uniref:BON domain-containing protein n=1 Tax=Methylocaldum szegediense TaxID=73780 RepID=A0ABM9I038_9GAMM|nr:peptidoglycan-binding protein LysM [Methylocaldum szegediense]CAI8801969.1 BON domain-containing protein [Methylocaldum szegediense]
MGLFDFARDIGHRLFTEEGHAARKIEEHINQNNPGIKNLKVDFRDSVAYLSGEAESAEAVQKAALMAGNIKGVEAVKVEGVKLPAGVSSPETVETFGETQYYVIQPGDTLSKIAQRFYKDANKYSKIFEANREVIKDPDLIFPGQKIRIPIEH